MTRAYHCPCGIPRDANTEACRDCEAICDACARIVSRAEAFTDGIAWYCSEAGDCVDAALERARMSAAFNARVLGIQPNTEKGAA